MNRFITAVIASTAVAATVLAPVAGAYAGERHGHRHFRHHHHHHRPVIVHRDNGAAVLAAGILGLAAGAIIAGANNPPPPEEPYRPSRPSPHRDYFPEAPGQTASIAEPWSAEWYRYCAQRFRSFDSQTGTYLGYDGKRHFCVAK